MKTKKGTNVSRKKVINFYKNQCHFFGQVPLADYELSGLTAKQIYRRGEALYSEQPLEAKKAFSAALHGVEYEPPLNWFEKILAKFKKKK